MTEKNSWSERLESWLNDPSPLLFLESTLDPQKPAARLAEHGIRAGVVRLEAVTDKASMMQAFARDLNWPAWFGANWDALADLLSDDEATGAGGFVLILTAWRDFSARDPESATTLLEIIKDVHAETNSPLLGAVVLA